MLIKMSVLAKKRERLLLAFLSALAVVSLIGSFSMPASAGLEEAKEQINKTMVMLGDIADTGVGVAIVPFGIAFAMSIAGKILSKA